MTLNCTANCMLSAHIQLLSPPSSCISVPVNTTTMCHMHFISHSAKLSRQLNMTKFPIFGKNESHNAEQMTQNASHQICTKIIFQFSVFWFDELFSVLMFTIIQKLHTAMRTRQIVISTWATTKTNFCTQKKLKVHKNIFFNFNAAARVWHSIVSFSIVRQRARRVRSAICAHKNYSNTQKKATQSNILRDFCDDDISHWPGLNVRLSEHAAINMENLVSEKVALSARMHFNFYRVRCLAVVVCRKKCIFLWKLTSCSAFFSPMRHHEKKRFST